MNKLFLYGRIASDLELKQTKNNKSYLNFAFAVNNKSKNSEFIPLIAWDKNANFIKQHADKGSALLLECNLTINKFTDKTGNSRSNVEVVVQNVTLLESTTQLNIRKEKNAAKQSLNNQAINQNDFKFDEPTYTATPVQEDNKNLEIPQEFDWETSFEQEQEKATEAEDEMEMEM
ncbi:single-stranded DNA-binding protein [[Mycoplasma] collis]|uniref:single-stranded DNA-binding protein n=1 Tax=[Mycoplasma] collis TaxID=2127 RepID=UPI00051B4062|nr:single-stranded DNA-binding protein [[Mycoplasma] collis]